MYDSKYVFYVKVMTVMHGCWHESSSIPIGLFFKRNEFPPNGTLSAKYWYYVPIVISQVLMFCISKSSRYDRSARRFCVFAWPASHDLAYRVSDVSGSKGEQHFLKRNHRGALLWSVRSHSNEVFFLSSLNGERLIHRKTHGVVQLDNGSCRQFYHSDQRLETKFFDPLQSCWRPSFPFISFHQHLLGDDILASKTGNIIRIQAQETLRKH